MIVKILEIVKKYLFLNLDSANQSAGIRRYFNNTSWLFLGQGLSLLISFFIGAMIARRLGPSSYGVLSYALSFTTLFGIFFCFGVDAAMNRELIKYPEKEKELLGTFWLFKLGGGILTLLVATGAAVISRFDWLTVKLIAIFSGIFIIQSLGIITLFFQAKVNARKSSLAQVWTSFIMIPVKLLWFFYSGNIMLLAFIYIFDFVVLGIFLIRYYQSKGNILSWKFDKQIFKDIFHSSVFLMFSGVAILGVLKIDQIIIGHFLGKTAVGLYAVADRLTEAWDFIPRLICLSLFAAIINARKVDFTLYNRRLKHLYYLMLGLALLIMTATLVISRPLIIFLFGPEYEEAINILRVYVLSLPGIFLFTAVNQRLVAEGREKRIFLANFSALAINIILNFVFLPRFGLIGSAWATVITFIYLPIFMLLSKTKQPLSSVIEVDKSIDPSRV